MYELYYQKLREKVDFSDDDLALIKTYLTPKKIKKEAIPATGRRCMQIHRLCSKRCNEGIYS